jgi:hypothetical protein
MSKSLRRDIAQLGSQLLDEVVTERYNMLKHHPAEDVPNWFINYMETRLLAEINSERSKLELKIESVIDKHYTYENAIDEQIRVNKILDEIIKALTQPNNPK